MRRLLRSGLIGSATLAFPILLGAQTTEAFRVPVEYHKLGNGLRVVLSPDHTAPTVTVGVYYNIGFRIEPQSRTGFAHLFEHMMFQGSGNLGKMEFVRLIQNNGGVLNGSTRFDFTNYFEIVPAHKLETILWAEADRMKGLDITQENLTNQQGVVKNEVKVNVINQPYGGFPWLDLPQYANTNWYNAHNFYGELEHLDAATLADVQSFFRTYYAPNNAALAITGDFDPAQALRLIRKYFEGIPAATLPPKPDLTEPRQTAEKRFTRVDSLARRPGLAFAYHMPARNTPEWAAMGLLDQILLQGRDSRLNQAVVQEHGLAGGIGGGINLLGNMLNYNGPMLWMASLIHDPDKTPDQILAVVDSVLATVRSAPVSDADLARAKVKLKAGLYQTMSGFGLVDLLASFALFDDNPGRVNQVVDEINAVTAEQILRTAREYLQPANRTVLLLEAAGSSRGGE